MLLFLLDLFTQTNHGDVRRPMGVFIGEWCHIRPCYACESSLIDICGGPNCYPYFYGTFYLSKFYFLWVQIMCLSCIWSKMKCSYDTCPCEWFCFHIQNSSESGMHQIFCAKRILCKKKWSLPIKKPHKCNMNLTIWF
jgi:hypothetical protein